MASQVMSFKEASRNGLRPHPDMELNAQYLARADNRLPTERGLKKLGATQVAYPVTDVAQSRAWPHQQLMKADDNVLLFGPTSVHTINQSTWAGTAVTTYDATSQGATKSIQAGTGLWHVAGFNASWFATKGNSIVYYIPSNTSARTVVAEGVLAFNTVVNHDGTIVIGGPSGTHFSTSQWLAVFEKWQKTSPQSIFTDENAAIGTNYIIYGPPGGGDSEIPLVQFMAMLGLPGTATYDAKYEGVIHTMIEDGSIGLLPLRGSGAIYVLKKYGESLISYNERTISRLARNPNTGRYEEEILFEFGAIGRGCVNGTDKEHVFVTGDAELMRGILNQGFEKLYRREFLSTLTAAKLVVTHDPFENYYWISDDVDAYVWTRTGLGRSQRIRPSSLLRHPHSSLLLGTFDLVADPAAVFIETHPFDFGDRLLKEVSFIDLETVETDAAGIQVWMRARFNKTDASMTSFQAYEENADQRGRARVSVSGVDFAAVIEHADDSEFNTLDSFEAVRGDGKPSLRKWHNV